MRNSKIFVDFEHWAFSIPKVWLKAWNIKQFTFILLEKRSPEWVMDVFWYFSRPSVEKQISEIGTSCMRSILQVVTITNAICDCFSN